MFYFAAELGLHGVLDQAKSRGDPKPVAADPSLGLYSTRYTHKAPAGKVLQNSVKGRRFKNIVVRGRGELVYYKLPFSCDLFD